MLVGLHFLHNLCVENATLEGTHNTVHKLVALCYPAHVICITSATINGILFFE